MDESYYGMILIPIIVGVVAIFKPMLPTKFLPLLSILFGIFGAFVIYEDWKEAVLMGIVSGLSASGLWSGTKATIEKKL